MTRATDGTLHFCGFCPDAGQLVHCLQAAAAAAPEGAHEPEAADPTQDAVAVFGADWRLLFGNAAFVQAAELPGLELFNLSLEQVLPELAAPAPFRELQGLLEQGHSWQGVLSRERPQAQASHHLALVFPIRGLGRSPHQAFVLVLRTARTGPSEMLEQTQKMEALGTLAGGVAHDFNNILTAILSATELIHIQIPAGSPARPALEIIVQAARRAKSLNHQILTFSRKGQERKIPFDLSALIKEATRLLKSTLPINVTVRAEVAGPLWTHGDANKLHQVFMNLAINGFQAMGPEGGELTITLRALQGGADPRPMVRLAIQDTGCGMEADLLDRIFEPFFTTRANREGTGLGLSVVHGIVKGHDGRIVASSEPGRGSLFQVFLPSVPTPAPAGDQASESPIEGCERILLVDDDDFVAALVKNGLQAWGYQVTAKTSSLDALAAFTKAPGTFDLLLTDQVMPDLTGAELAERLRGIRPDLPAILLTGTEQPSGLGDDGRAGFQETLLKPQSTLELARAIRRVLDQRRPGPAAAGSGAGERTRTILLVERDGETLAALRAILGEAGYPVRQAGDSQTAWECFHAAPASFRMVITGLSGPDLGGVELIRRVRALDRGIPILVISDFDPETPALEHLVSGCLSRPLEPTMLRECVRYHFEREAAFRVPGDSPA